MTGGVYAVANSGRDYAFIGEGVSLDVGAGNPWTALVRAQGYHVVFKEPTGNPISPNEKRDTRLHFSRIQGGLRYALPRRAALEVLAGKDGFDSRANTAEGLFSCWPVLGGYHPVQLSLGGSFNDRTRIAAASLGGTVGLGLRGGWLWLGSGYAEAYKGGSLTKTLGRMGAGVRASRRDAGWGFEFSGGGGANGPFAQFSFFKPFKL